MHITRIAAKNYKTYRDLDIDLSVNDEQPIVLIGGLNGGGKTTLFQAIYSALYGLEIEDLNHFKRLLSASVEFEENVRIELQIDFKGKVLGQDYFYIIKRIYALNSQMKPMESVNLNFNGDQFIYGSAMPLAQRAKMEAEVNKIIKANLPKELSRYFLFDAMESGNLLKEDYLTRVIKENIENVMGFNKYIMLREASERLKARYIEESLELEEERQEYNNLVKSKLELEKKIRELKELEQIKLGYLLDQKEYYNKAKEGVNLQKEFQDQMKLYQSRINSLKAKQKEYVESISKYSAEIEMQAIVPKLVSVIRDELQLIVSKFSDDDGRSRLTNEQLTYVGHQLDEFLTSQNLIDEHNENLSEEFISYLENSFKKSSDIDQFSFLSSEELDTIKILLNNSSLNSFSSIKLNKESLERELKSLPSLLSQLEETKRMLSDDEFSIIGAYEKAQAEQKDIIEKLKDLERDIEDKEKRINKYDISDEQVPNPKLELCKKLGPLFNDISNSLLVMKKQHIEQTMKEDLNLTLVAYANEIKRVELSEDMSNLTFKIYHNAGNEIYLEELNAASKQIIVQVLLKALHQFGDYNPPVMIDTVMGYLDEDSRAALLENYFPKLSHQTILFSTDSEIRKDKDLKKIEPFISKKFTLVRDKKKQLTEVFEGYFND